ncbi:MAG: radical SAM family heme chaperone HemW [Bdellovibrionales bacterium]|nr:radical SAM family heme chaperone HemW [Bdellovibrionales bacterium]
MKFGVYVHIPYCIQRCHYCDFTTFEQNSIMPPEDYLELLLQEITQRSTQISPKELTSIYFGGGTPSLFPIDYIHKIIEKLELSGLFKTKNTEITIEINPTTINTQKVKQYLDIGINRFSVGAQTFSDPLLKTCGREHNSQQTLDTLDILADLNTNFSLDILYALPLQGMEQLEIDIQTALQFKPKHISAYCLTIPSGHPMNKGRPKEGLQVEMLERITQRLNQNGLFQYEISNFARPHMESKHNLLYWEDQSYWGIGLSAHSSLSTWEKGLRFWNPKDFKTYKKQVEAPTVATYYPHQYLPDSQFEELKTWEALTDFCHISLRLNKGLSKDALRYRFGHEAESLVAERLQKVIKSNQVNESPSHWFLTNEGRKISNKVFFELTFLKEDFLH